MLFQTRKIITSLAFMRLRHSDHSVSLAEPAVMMDLICSTGIETLTSHPQV
jgi:hypothetical protein